MILTLCLELVSCFPTRTAEIGENGRLILIYQLDGITEMHQSFFLGIHSGIEFLMLKILHAFC